MRTLYLSDVKKFAASIFFLIGLAIAAALLAPPEEHLGDVAKLVYAHAAQAWIGMIGFTVAAFFSILFLVTGQDRHYAWAESFQKTGLVWWFIHVSSSLVVMELAWGGIFWQEPRFHFALTFMLISLVLFLFTVIVNHKYVSAGLFFVSTFIMYTMILRTDRIMHPANPIFGADRALGIKLYTITLVLIFIAMIVQCARWWHAAVFGNENDA